MAFGIYFFEANYQSYHIINELTVLFSLKYVFFSGAAINTNVPDLLPFQDISPILSRRLEEGTGVRGALTSNSGNLGSLHSATPKVKKYHLLKLPGELICLIYHKLFLQCNKAWQICWQTNGPPKGREGRYSSIIPF